VISNLNTSVTGCEKLPTIEGMPDGDPVTLKFLKNTAELIETIETIIISLKNQNVSCSNITLLSPKKSNLCNNSSIVKDAIRAAHGKIEGQDLVVACMDFAFIGGSMGSVVGEKIARSIDYCIKNKIPFLLISKSGGARMMEAAFSLMQMAKTSAKLALLSRAKIPYISLLTDPTTGGVTASYAMLGDINIAEPGALIGFAGPRVIKETIKRDLPKGFQTSEFVLEHGFLDFIVDRSEMKAKIASFIRMMAN
jgi:acetyl-CoA carboxylase carboxyl transferase subunit beta